MMLKKKMSLLMIFTILFSYVMFMTKVNATSYDVYTVKSGLGKKDCPIRTGPGTNNGIIKNGNDNVYVYANQNLEYIKTESGTNDGKITNWYAVKFDYAAREYTGYVVSACVSKKTYSYNDDSSFEQKISVFPDSYKPYLRKLHAIYPNWTFEADYTGLDWETAAEAESQKGTSAISHLYPSLIFKDSMNPNGIIVDGTSWYAPAKDAVKYYMDPRNFLSEKNIFMFQSLSYNQNEDSSVQKMFDGSFMEGTFTENGNTKTYANAFIEAAKEAGVSSVHLASRSLQEVGTKGSSVTSGTVPGYEGYYNFYNIGAYSGADNYLKGLQYAKDNGWNSRQKAITEGAKFIGSGYITKGQDTLYFQKFNVSQDRTRKEYTHQYQTNIMAPESESASIYKSYQANGKLGNNYNFVIPVYNNRPDTAFKVSRTDTVGGSTTPSIPDNNQNGNNDNGEEKPSDPVPPKPVVSPETKILNAGYKLNSGYLTGVTYGQDVSLIRGNMQNNGASVGYMNNSWNTKTSGRVATGDIITIDDKAFQVAVYGDISGDGNINIKDLLLIQKYLLRSQNLTESNKEAADVSHDGAVTIKDLLLVQKYLLGTGNILQK